jgi:hypothetical protein
LIVETLNDFCDTVFGGRIKIYTDRKNLTYKLSQFSTQRVLRWQLLIEDYETKFHYKPGPENLIANCLSRVQSKRFVRESKDEKPLSNTDDVYCMIFDDPDMAECLYHDPKIAECFLEHPVFDAEGRLSFQFKTLEEEYQSCSEELQTMPLVFPKRFSREQLIWRFGADLLPPER